MEQLELLNFGEETSFSVIKEYGEDMTAKKYITDPAIARESELKKLILVLLTPEKSGLLVGAPGIGKTAIVEGIAYRIQRGEVPDALKGYRIIKLTSSSLLGKMTVGGKEELVMSMLVKELKTVSKIILFIDEIHTLIGNGESTPMDLANILKTGLDRGDVKAIGATTTNEYSMYIVKDRAFLRRFEKIDVLEPDQPTTVRILVESIPKIEQQTGVKMNYNNYEKGLLMTAIVNATSEFKRVYGLSAMYPDICFSVLTSAFSEALFQNHKEVKIIDIYNAIRNSKRIYPDSIVKELEAFRKQFQPMCDEKKEGILPVVKREELEENQDVY